jgi:hypothetical protein
MAPIHSELLCKKLAAYEKELLTIESLPVTNNKTINQPPSISGSYCLMGLSNIVKLIDSKIC